MGELLVKWIKNERNVTYWGVSCKIKNPPEGGFFI
jgi:hypothetical protein